jgi:TetR/AcrR family transcriptional regulator
MPSAQAPATTRQRQRERTRDLILSAAIKVFARAGFDAASLADIGRNAGVKKTLVQYHFATKELLWKMAATRIWSERNQALSEALAQDNGDLNKKMRDGFTVLARFTRDNPQWLWFMFHEAAANSPRLQWLVDNFLRDDYILGQKFVSQFQKLGVIRDGAPLHLVHLISGALTYNLLVAPQTEQVTGVDLSSEASIAQQVELLSQLLTPQDH